VYRLIGLSFEEGDRRPCSDLSAPASLRAE
jgi:hypothetical protein